MSGRGEEKTPFLNNGGAGAGFSSDAPSAPPLDDRYPNGDLMSPRTYNETHLEPTSWMVPPSAPPAIDVLASGSDTKQIEAAAEKLLPPAYTPPPPVDDGTEDAQKKEYCFGGFNSFLLAGCLVSFIVLLILNNKPELFNAWQIPLFTFIGIYVVFYLPEACCCDSTRSYLDGVLPVLFLGWGDVRLLSSSMARFEFNSCKPYNVLSHTHTHIPSPPTLNNMSTS